MQKAIPALFMRGGTSRGPFFHEADLPQDIASRDAVLLSVMGSPDPRQIDGLGGGHPLRSKVGIIRRSSKAGIDIDFLFCQVSVDKALVNTTLNCGNMLSAVVPFALETGLVKASGEQTKLRVLTRNTGMTCDITVQTPNGQVSYEGNARIAGVPGTSAPIWIDFLDTAGSVCQTMLPTGNIRDQLTTERAGNVEVTCIDNGMPMVLLRASDVGVSGYESVTEMNANAELKAKINALRLVAGRAMGLGDVEQTPFPKMCLLASPRSGGVVSTRCFIPHVCHTALGVLQAVTVASACVMTGSVGNEVASVPDGTVKSMGIEHPSGTFDVELEMESSDSEKPLRARILRTARLIMRGKVMVPGSVWGAGTDDY